MQGTDADAIVTTDNLSGFSTDRPQANILDGDKTTRCDLDSANVGDFQYGIFVDIEVLLDPTIWVNSRSIPTTTPLRLMAIDTNTMLSTRTTLSSKVGFNTAAAGKRS